MGSGCASDNDCCYDGVRALMVAYDSAVALADVVFENECTIATTSIAVSLKLGSFDPINSRIVGRTLRRGTMHLPSAAVDFALPRKTTSLGSAFRMLPLPAATTIAVAAAAVVFPGLSSTDMSINHCVTGNEQRLKQARD
ncbi:hypothetical protein GW17_00019276 [Ensete ventricosum]|nr:hypothetical protein GW17_00019276 [Ensete ventricosum]